MRTLVKIYWLRFTLGIVAAFLCACYGIAFPGVISKEGFPLNTFFNSMSLTFIVYIVSFAIIKRKFAGEVKDQRKLATTGIGIYFIAWLVFWVLLYTIIASQLP